MVEVAEDGIVLRVDDCCDCSAKGFGADVHVDRHGHGRRELERSLVVERWRRAGQRGDDDRYPIQPGHGRGRIHLDQ